MRTPSSAIAPKRYLPDSDGTTLPVQRAEKLSAGTPGPGLDMPQSKLSAASSRFKTGVPARFLLSKYSALKPPRNAESGTGVTVTSVIGVPKVCRTFVPGETRLRIPASGVVAREGVPL